MAAGPAALAIGTEAALLAGTGIIGLAVVGILASPDVRRLEHHPASPATSPDTKSCGPGDQVTLVVSDGG
jgi:hypothetical protein